MAFMKKARVGKRRSGMAETRNSLESLPPSRRPHSHMIKRQSSTEKRNELTLYSRVFAQWTHLLKHHEDLAQRSLRMKRSKTTARAHHLVRDTRVTLRVCIVRPSNTTANVTPVGGKQRYGGKAEVLVENGMRGCVREGVERAETREGVLTVLRSSGSQGAQQHF
jgi:hypothetical protein